MLVEKNIHVDKLLINKENPRFEPTDTEKMALYTMANQQGEKLINLAKDIIENGLSPLENIAVMPSETNGYYIVKEGNRRISCLKILKDISEFKDIHGYDKFLNLASQITNLSIFKIKCTVFENEEECNRWIHLKHTGENKGRGIVSWDTPSQERFKELTGKELTSGFIAYKFIQSTGYIFKKKPTITTINRILNSKPGKKYFKFYLNKGKLINENTDEEIIKKLTHLFELVDDNVINSRNTNTVSEIELKLQELFPDDIERVTIVQNSSNVEGNIPVQIDLFKDITNESKDTLRQIENVIYNNQNMTRDKIDPKEMLDQVIDKKDNIDQENNVLNETSDISVGQRDNISVDSTSDSQVSVALANKPNSKRIRQIPHSTQRKTVIPSLFKIRTSESKINNLVHELKSLEVDNFPNAASISLRVLIEITVDYYGDLVNCFTGLHNPSLADKIKRIRKHLAQNGFTEDQLIPFDNILGAPNTIYSTNTFNKYVHHTKFQASPSDLKLAWDNIQSFMEIFLAK